MHQAGMELFLGDGEPASLLLKARVVLQQQLRGAPKLSRLYSYSRQHAAVRRVPLGDLVQRLAVRPALSVECGISRLGHDLLGVGVGCTAVVVLPAPGQVRSQRGELQVAQQKGISALAVITVVLTHAGLLMYRDAHYCARAQQRLQIEEIGSSS
jgi:hypothetical protein